MIEMRWKLDPDPHRQWAEKPRDYTLQYRLFRLDLASMVGMDASRMYLDATSKGEWTEWRDVPYVSEDK